MRITKKNIIITTTKTTITTNKLKSRYNRNRKYLRIFIRNQKYTYENKRMYVSSLRIRSKHQRSKENINNKNGANVKLHKQTLTV